MAEETEPRAAAAAARPRGGRAGGGPAGAAEVARHLRDGRPRRRGRGGLPPRGRRTRARCTPTPRRSRTCARRSRSATRIARLAARGDRGPADAAPATTRPRWPPTRRPRPSPPPPSSARSSTGSAGSTTAAASWALATAHLEAALAATPEDELAAARADLRRPQPLSAHDGGDAARAAALAEAPALAEQAGDPRALGQAHNLLGVLATSDGAARRGARPPRRGRAARRGARRPWRARRRAQQPRARAPRARASSSRALELTRRGAGAVRRPGRPPPRGGAAQQPRRPPPRRGPPRRRDGRAQARGRDLRRGRCGGRAAPEVWKLARW